MAKYIPLKDWQKKQNLISMSVLRRLINERYTNGFHRVVRKIGGRWFVVSGEFSKWIEWQNKEEEKRAYRVQNSGQSDCKAELSLYERRAQIYGQRGQGLR